LSAHVGRWWFPLARRAWSPGALALCVAALILAHHALAGSTLAEDEAHYWEWSEHLDWSYATKGPGVAWAIRASTMLLGDTELAVRLPSLAALVLVVLGAARLTRESFDEPEAPFVAAVLSLGAPALVVAGYFATIDAPYLACWAWACVCAQRAIRKDAPRAWIGFGAAVALGFLFKYTIVLLIPGALTALLMARRRHGAWFTLGALVASLGLAPVLIWNASHDWVTIRHLLGHLGAPGGDTGPADEPWTPVWALEFVTVQLAVCGPALVLGIIGIVRRRADPSTRTLALLALPILAFYLGVSLVTRTEGNWAIAGVIPLVPVAARLVVQGVRAGDRFVRTLWGAALTLAIVGVALVPAAPYLAERRVIGPLIPAARFHGLREHARHAQRVLDDLRARTASDPFVMSAHYGRASQLAFYLRGEPDTYGASAALGGRRTQYDIWPHTDLRNPETHARLLGRDALLMGGSVKEWEALFARVEPIGPLESEPVDDRGSFLGFGYTGAAAVVDRSVPDDADRNEINEDLSP